MSDADDAGLVDTLRRWAHREFTDGTQALIAAADRIESQRREIEELRWELAEALKVIGPFATYGRLPSFDKLPADMSVTYGSRMAAKQLTVGDIIAASAFAAKHGGRDG